MVKDRLKDFGKKFGNTIANSFGKAVYKIKDEWQLHKKVAKHGAFVGGAATGAALGIAGKGWGKFKEHVWSRNQFDKLIWLGLLYYGLQWYYKLGLGIDVFSNVPYEFMLINFVMALLVLIFFFKPNFIEFISTGAIIILYLFIINTGFKIDLPIVGELGLLFTLIIVTVGIILILREIFHIDVFGVTLVSLTFLLEIGFKIFIANIIPVPILINFLLYMPYWLFLALIAGGYVEGKVSKLIGFFRGLSAIIIIFFFVSNLLLVGTMGGATKFTIDPGKKEEGRKAFEEGWENFKAKIDSTLSVITCATDPNYQECVAEKTAPKKEKKLTEEELLSFSINREKPRRMNMYFTPIDISLDGVIFTQLRGQSSVDGKDINFSCSVNEIPGIVNPPITFTEKNNLNWWEDIECTSELKSNNEVEFIAHWRQKTETNYPNYFIDYDELNKILEKHKTADYVEMERKCKDNLCIRNVQKRLYQNIKDFRTTIINDYPTFETSSIVDKEAVYLLLHTDYIPIIRIKENEETEIDLIIKIANMEQGEIITVHNIEIEFPDFIESDCDIKLENIDWSKIKFGIENQKRIGKCKLKINKNKIKYSFSDMSKLNKAVIKGVIDFEYQLKSKENVRYYG